MSRDQTRAVLYARLSKDFARTGAGVDRQLEDARKLAAVRGFTVIAEHENVVLRHNGEVIGSTSMADLVESSENLDHLPENLETAARAILSNVQDWIADTSYEPWPGTQSQPNPGAQFSDGILAMWFGDQENPVLSLAPLGLD